MIVIEMFNPLIRTIIHNNNIEPDTRMAKNRKDFRRFSSAGTAMDKIVNVKNNEFIRMWHDVSTYSAQLVYCIMMARKFFITLKSLPCHMLYVK